MKRLITVALCWSAVSRAEPPADDEHPSLPCRPTVSCTADIVRPGSLEIEAGYLFHKLSEPTHSVPLLVKLTLAEWVPAPGRRQRPGVRSSSRRSTSKTIWSPGSSSISPTSRGACRRFRGRWRRGSARRGVRPSAGLRSVRDGVRVEKLRLAPRRPEPGHQFVAARSRERSPTLDFARALRRRAAPVHDHGRELLFFRRCAASPTGTAVCARR